MNRLALVLTVLTTFTACTPEDEPLTSSDDAIKVLNGAATDALAFNSLIGGRYANKALMRVPLRSASFDFNSGHPALRLPLHDPAARVFMNYLYSCALGASDQLIWRDKADPAAPLYTFQGKLDLCPSWGHGPPSRECLEVVSACILARNNGYGMVVPISVRGVAETGQLPVRPDEAPFVIPEGAFYGTIFDPDALATNIFVDPFDFEIKGRPSDQNEPEVVFRNMYSCSAPVWAHPIAYAHHRECAEPVRAVGCLANYAGGCEPEASSAGVCEIRDVSGVGDGDYGKCWGGSTGAPWERPLTVYLDRYDAIVSGKPARPLGQQDGRPDDRFRF